MPPSLRQLPPGTAKADVDTPTLVVDLDLFEANVRQVAAQCRAAGIAWRPHAKGHKQPEIARRQLAAGALGITCAKLGEAEVMADAGIRDLLVANMVVGPHKVRRLAELCRRADPIVCVDHIDQVLPVSRALAGSTHRVRILIEVDLGLGRVGVPPGEPTLRLAEQVWQLPGIEFVGVMGYEGHLLTLSDPDEKRRQIHAALEQLVETARLLRRSGIPSPIVSCAGTGSFQISITHPGITEVQAGGAIFMDCFYREKCQVRDLDFALTILTTVVSRPAPDRAIIDAGRKTMNIEIATPRVLGRDDIHVERLSAEHGQLRLDPSAQDLRIGDRLEIVPGYADLTTVLHDEFLGFRGGRLEVVWPLEARGRLQ